MRRIGMSMTLKLRERKAAFLARLKIADRRVGYRSGDLKHWFAELGRQEGCSVRTAKNRMEAIRPQLRRAAGLAGSHLEA
jgi:hypothetical protein